MRLLGVCYIDYRREVVEESKNEELQDKVKLKLNGCFVIFKSSQEMNDFLGKIVKHNDAYGLSNCSQNHSPCNVLLKIPYISCKNISCKHQCSSNSKGNEYHDCEHNKSQQK